MDLSLRFETSALARRSVEARPSPTLVASEPPQSPSSGIVVGQTSRTASRKLPSADVSILAWIAPSVGFKGRESDLGCRRPVELASMFAAIIDGSLHPHNGFIDPVVFPRGISVCFRKTGQGLVYTGFSLHSGASSPGDHSHSSICDAVLVRRALRIIASRHGPGGRAWTYTGGFNSLKSRFCISGVFSGSSTSQSMQRNLRPPVFTSANLFGLPHFEQVGGGVFLTMGRSRWIRQEHNTLCHR